MADPRRDLLLGVDIGGTKCAVLLGRGDGDDQLAILERVAFPTALRGPGPVFSEIVAAVEALLLRQSATTRDIRGVGISCGGPLDSSRGVVLGPPNLPGWDDVPISSMFCSEFGAPAQLLNDADAGALAEWRLGAGRGSRHMVFLTFGTGMGAGMILNGKLYSGATGMAGEVGHIRLEQDGPLGYGKRGSFEGFCSGGGIASAARDRIRAMWSAGERIPWCQDEAALDTLSAASVFDADRSGDVVAKGILDSVAHQLGRGLSILVDLLNPDMIVVGSIFARQRDRLWPIASAVLEREALSNNRAACKIVPAALGDAIGDYACLLAAELAIATPECPR